jgi:hypothetical protein
MIGTAQAADLEQLARLRLDALGGVDHHDRRIDRGQRAIGIFGKSSWPGVSSRLKVMPSRSKVITELVTEMPRCCSIFIQSDRARRAWPRALTSPAKMDAPPCSSSFSVSVVLTSLTRRRDAK